jgi:hypothetical protein
VTTNGTRGDELRGSALYDRSRGERQPGGRTRHERLAAAILKEAWAYSRPDRACLRATKFGRDPLNANWDGILWQSQVRFPSIRTVRD